MRVLILGCGALGSHVVYCGRNLIDYFGVIDFDRVEMKNLLSQWFVKQSVGKNKAAALKMQVLNFLGTTPHIEPYQFRFEKVNLSIVQSYDFLVDCFDNAESRMFAKEAAKKYGKELLHAGLSGDGTLGRVAWNRFFNIDQEDTKGQATCENGEFLPLIIKTASIVVQALEEKVKRNRITNYTILPNEIKTF